MAKDEMNLQIAIDNLKKALQDMVAVDINGVFKEFETTHYIVTRKKWNPIS